MYITMVLTVKCTTLMLLPGSCMPYVSLETIMLERLYKRNIDLYFVEYVMRSYGALLSYRLIVE